MYASHRDAAIYAWYSHQLTAKLDELYQELNISDCVIAYRALGKANYHFSAEAHAFAVAHSPCIIMAYDVTGFFDNIRHSRLKARIKEILKVEELSLDWYSVFRSVTNFSFVDLAELQNHPVLKDRFLPGVAGPIGSVAELKRLGVQFKANGLHLPKPRNPDGTAIPQGTPLSATLSNAYMLEFDVKMKAACTKMGALYRRYSDDILVICDASCQSEVDSLVAGLLNAEGLQLSPGKTEVTDFDPYKPAGRRAQYLGFSYYDGGAGMRPSTLSRAWRKMRTAVRAAKKEALHDGRPLRSKRLYKRFSPVFDPNQKRYLRNFPAYAKRGAAAFGKGEKVTKQLQRFYRGFQRELRRAKDDVT